jgi:hypothetical protein
VTGDERAERGRVTELSIRHEHTAKLAKEIYVAMLAPRPGGAVIPSLAKLAAAESWRLAEMFLEFEATKLKETLGE